MPAFFTPFKTAEIFKTFFVIIEGSHKLDDGFDLNALAVF
jgi:hypothetical protein